MPISSTQVSAMAGGFNQQVMLGMQHSAMITNQFGGYAPNPAYNPTPTTGQNFANMMTMAGGNLGMRAMGALDSVPILGGMASSFGGMGISQMMYGAQQQQMLQSNMQQAYRHPNEYGGRGFTQTQIHNIGSSLRDMSLERGPGGEQTSFEELGRLASNMGRMGLAQNVRSVKDFNEKFKEMLKTVKTVAEEMGTSLEEAQKMMVSMKGSGIFNNQAQVAQMMRQGALAGNLGLSELSAAGMMGSHISRSIGGRGRSGAMAGIATMSNIGAGLQAGVINEEDIYNVTGMTGAEGRQAMAQRQMSGDADFLRSGFGRRLLASIAGKGGQINEGDVQRYMAGGVGTSETMEMAHGNLAKVGRADFIRNEGRLRGEALKAFGGNLRATVAKGWLEQRGMDMGSDRARLFLQRKFRINREEADVLLQQVQGLEATKMQQDISRQEDEFAQEMDTAQRKQSPAEIVKKFEDARDRVTNKVRQFGADVNSQLAGFLDNVMKKITKSYEMRVDRTLGPAIKALRTGHASEATMAREFGMGKMGGTLSDQATALAGDFRGNTGVSAQQIAGYVSGNYDALRTAGYSAEDIKGIKTVADVDRIQREMVKKGQGGLVGMLQNEGRFATAEAEQFALGRGAMGRGRGNIGEFNVLKDPLTQASLFAGGDATALGRGIQGVESFLSRNVMDPLDRMRKAALGEGGLAEGLSTMPRRAITGLVGGLERGARGLLGDETVTKFAGKDLTGRVGGALERFLGEGESRLGASIGALLGGPSIGSIEAAGEFLKAGEGKEMLKDVFTGDIRARTKLDLRTQKRIKELSGKDKLSDEEEGELAGLKSVRAGLAWSEWAEKNGRQPETEEEIAEVAREAGVDPSEVRDKARMAGAAYEGSKDDRRRQAVETSRRAAQKQLGQVRDTLKAGRDGTKKLSPESAKYLEAMEESLSRQASVTAGVSGAEVKGALKTVEAEGKTQASAFEKAFGMKGLSVKEKRERAAQMREEGLEGEAAIVEERAGLEQRFAQGKRLGGGGLGVTREIGRAVGVELSRDDLRKLRGKGPEEAVKAIMEQSGVSGLEGQDSTKEEIKKKLMDISKAKSPEEQAKLMQGLRQEHGSTFVEGRKDQQEKKSEAEDPSYRKLGEIKEGVDKIGKDMVVAVNNLGTTLGKTISEAGGGLFG